MATGWASEVELGRIASVDLNLLPLLLALLEERSVTRAAAQVGLSQPALSHALGRMRRLLGDELLVRQGGRMVPTERAEQLLPELRRTLQQASRLVASQPFEPATDTRTVTMGMTTSTAYLIGPHLAKLVHERGPRMTLRIRTIDFVSESAFTEDLADLILVSGAYETTQPRERLREDSWVVITGSTDSTDVGALDLLTTRPHIIFDGGRPFVPYTVLEEHGISYTVGMRLSDSLLVPRFVSSTGGVAVHRRLVTETMSRYMDLRIAEFPLPVGSIGIEVVFNPWLADGTFKQWLRALLADAAELV